MIANFLTYLPPENKYIYLFLRHGLSFYSYESFWEPINFYLRSQFQSIIFHAHDTTYDFH